MYQTEHTKKICKSFSLPVGNILTHAPKGVKLSKHTRLKLQANELEKLQEFLKQPGAYATIKANTNIGNATVKRVIESGSGQVGVVVKLRDFLKRI